MTTDELVDELSDALEERDRLKALFVRLENFQLDTRLIEHMSERIYELEWRLAKYEKATTT